MTHHQKHIAALTRAYRVAKTPEAKEKLRVKIEHVKKQQATKQWEAQ